MKSYHETMTNLTFSPEQKQAMTEELLAAAQPEKKRFPRRTLVIAIAALLTLTITAGATGNLPSAAKFFAGIFGSSPAQTEIIDQIGRPIGASATADGYTITADAILGDNYNYTIIYSIQREDGQPMPELKHAQQTGDSYQSYRFKDDPRYVFFDADPADDSIQFKYSTSASNEIKKGRTTVKFENLTLYTGINAYSDNQETERLLAAGPWELTFRPDYEDASVSLTEGDVFHHNGAEAALTSVVLSPLSLNVEYTLDFEIDTSMHGDPFDSTEDIPMDRYVDSLPLVLHFKDGATKELTEEMGSNVGNKGGKAHISKNARFSEIIPPSTVESITIGDLTLPVEVEGPDTAAEFFADILGNEPNQAEVMGVMGRTLGVSDTDNGVTITAEAMIGDAHSVAVLYTISRDDGQPLIGSLEHVRQTEDGPVLRFESGPGLVRVNGRNGTFGNTYFLNPSDTASSLQFVEIVATGDGYRNGRTIRAKLTNLCALSDVDDSYLPIVQGTWRLTYPLNVPDSTVDLITGDPWLPARETFPFENTAVGPTELSISPLSIHMGFTIAPTYQGPVEEIPFFLTFTDGNTLDLWGSMNYIGTQGGCAMVYLCTGVFDEIHPLDTIESVTFGEMTFPVETP